MSVNTGNAYYVDESCSHVVETAFSLLYLDKEIDRVLQSQMMMRRVNRALRQGRLELLRGMAFSEAHILELQLRFRNKGDAFPAYLLRNNAKLLRSLRREQVSLTLRPAATQAAAALLPVVCEVL